MRELTTDAVWECIRSSVIDPELGINVVDLGLVYDIEIRDENLVYVEMTLTTPGCPIGPMFHESAQMALQSEFGSDVDVDLEIVWSPPWSPEMMSEDAKMELGFV
ncbi:MAG: metal-sulfur cluster assembly factor [Candidatus Bipolaricaulia bacterium]